MTSTSNVTLKDNTPIKLGILLFDEVEVLDFCGPFEVFAISGQVFDGLVTVTTIAENKQIAARHGLKVVVDHVLDINNLPKIDALLVPGGFGARAQSKNAKVIDWIKKLAPTLRFVLSVCTGVALLGEASVVDERHTITTHHLAYDFVQQCCPKSKLCKCRRYIDNGNIMTSAGISAGIDLSFHFIRKLYGADAATTVADWMEYDWTNPDYKENCDCK